MSVHTDVPLRPHTPLGPAMVGPRTLGICEATATTGEHRRFAAASLTSDSHQQTWIVGSEVTFRAIPAAAARLIHDESGPAAHCNSGEGGPLSVSPRRPLPPV